jgi:hypothetical protein
MNEMREDTIIWKDIPCSQTGRMNAVKMAMLSKMTYRVNAVPIKIPRKTILKFFHTNLCGSIPHPE